jgi:hypothetical protein
VRVDASANSNFLGVDEKPMSGFVVSDVRSRRLLTAAMGRLQTLRGIVEVHACSRASGAWVPCHYLAAHLIRRIKKETGGGEPQVQATLRD